MEVLYYGLFLYEHVIKKKYTKYINLCSLVQEIVYYE